MTSRKGKTKKGKLSIYDRYRQILDMPDLTDKEIDQMRNHLDLLVRTVCEHVWKKKFY